MGWALQQMNMSGGKRSDAPAAAGPVNVSTYTPPHHSQQQHIGYRDDQGVIWDIWWNGGWRLQAINLQATSGGKTPGPSAVLGPFIGVHNSQQHWAYIDSDGIIWDSWYDGDNTRWNLQRINGPGSELPAAPLAMNEGFADWIAIWNDASGQQGHFTYVGMDGVLYDAFSSSSTHQKPWNLQKITGAPDAQTPGGPVPTSTASQSNFEDRVHHWEEHVAYGGTQGDIYDSWYDSGKLTWYLQKINNGTATPNKGATSLPPAAAGKRPFVWPDHAKQNQHFTYLGADGAIFDAYRDKYWNWSSNQMTLGGGAVAGLNPLTPGPVSVSAPFQCNFGDRQEHIVYRDAAGTIQDVWLGDDFVWRLQQINLGGRTPGPATASDVFVWSIDNQQHFAYVDAKGVIWDAFYST